MYVNNNLWQPGEVEIAIDFKIVEGSDFFRGAVGLHESSAGVAALFNCKTWLTIVPGRWKLLHLLPWIVAENSMNSFSEKEPEKKETNTLWEESYKNKKHSRS